MENASRGAKAIEHKPQYSLSADFESCPIKLVCLVPSQPLSQPNKYVTEC